MPLTLRRGLLRGSVTASLFLQTCLKESDGSDTEDFCSDHSEDCLSEASWEPVDKKETEVRALLRQL